MVYVSQGHIVKQGSFAFGLSKSSPTAFEPGEVVGWLLATEVDEQGVMGHGCSSRSKMSNAKSSVTPSRASARAQFAQQ